MELASKQKCTACGACINICPKNILHLDVDDDGYYKVSIKTDTECTNCGLCTKVCPILKKFHYHENGSSYYACWNKDSAMRKLSASGGAFSALAVEFINRGGVVYGAQIDGFKIIHARAQSKDELIPMLGSKYQQGDLTNVFRQVRDDLKQNKLVLFSGMPCQVAGLKSFLLGINTSNLYTIDTICGGFTTMLPMTLLEGTTKYKEIHSFRNKDNGWKAKGFCYDLKMKKNTGELEDLKSNNLVLACFSSKLLKRASCCNCRFTSPNRQSDVTIGDFWGDIRFKTEHKDGVSVLAIHNDRIRAYIESSSLHFENITLEELTRFNVNYYWTKYPFASLLIPRYITLFAIRNGLYKLADYLLNYNSIFGLAVRLFIKLSHKSQKKVLNHIKILDNENRITNNL